MSLSDWFMWQFKRERRELDRTDIHRITIPWPVKKDRREPKERKK